MQKGWQGIFLQKLLDEKIIIRSEKEAGRQSFYETYDVSAIGRMLSNYDNADGTLIAKLLFPGENISIDIEPDLREPAKVTNMPLPGFVGAVAESDYMHKALMSMTAAIVDMREANTAIWSISIDSLKRIEEALLGFSGDMEAALANASKDANGIKKRLTGLEDSQVDLRKAIEGARSRMTSNQEQIDASVKSIEGLVGLTPVIDELIKNNIAQQESVEQLTGAIKATEANKLGIALRNLDITQRELGAVRELLLEVSSEEADKHGKPESRT